MTQQKYCLKQNVQSFLDIDELFIECRGSDKMEILDYGTTTTENT